MANPYEVAHARSLNDPNEFWGEIAQDIDWVKPWDKVLDDSNPPFYRWFSGAECNTCYNAVDRHVENGRGDQPAIIYDSPMTGGTKQTFTYSQLQDEVSRFAGVLRANGVQKGDRVIVYMPMIPQAPIAMLAIARLGAIHSVVFGGFAAAELATRIDDATPKAIVAASCGLEPGRTIEYKPMLDQAIELSNHKPDNVIIWQRDEAKADLSNPGDVDWAEAAKTAEPAECVTVAATDPLYILYTSGTTGVPKGILRDNGGHMVALNYTMKAIYDVKPGDVYWAASDVGWVVGHSYIVYGPLANGATTLMFEGVPSYPDASRFWQVVDKHKVNIFYTAPTAIRALMRDGNEPVKKTSRESLRLLGSVGEPINPEAWMWYYNVVGEGRCPIVDTWWQTETGGIMITPLAGITPTKPSLATLPLPGIQPVLLDHEGNELKGNSVEGILCIKYPWPGMLRTTWGDHQRCNQTYFASFPGYYLTGDGAKRDEEGYYRIIGRIDDVINVSGHRIGTAEVEDAINQHPKVVESAVVGYPHEIKGAGIYAYVICEELTDAEMESIEAEIRATVNKFIGPIAKPDKIQIVSGLPKTRSGKIMRRILRKIGEGDATNLGDTSTLLDPGVVDDIIDGAKVEVKR
jgi:acetate--CoA ligase